MSCIIMLEVALLLFLFLQFSNLEIVRSAQRFQAPAKGKMKRLCYSFKSMEIRIVRTRYHAMSRPLLWQHVTV